jgi:hypothetical protein
MKKQCTLFMLMFLGLTVFAQDNPGKNDEIKTLFGGEVSAGFYGSYDMKLTAFNSNAGLMTGGKGGWIIDHKFVIGGGGYGLSTRSPFDVSNTGSGDSIANLSCGYGGLLLEYILWPTKPVHVSFPIMIGAGGVNIYESSEAFFSEYSIGRLLERSSVFVAEPGANLELNLLKWFRFGLGLSYRYVYGSNLKNVSDNELSNLSMNFCFTFGYF